MAHNAASVPELEPYCGSWICSDPSNPERVTFETFQRPMAELAARHGYRVETAAQYLARINRATKEG